MVVLRYLWGFDHLSSVERRKIAGWRMKRTGCGGSQVLAE